MPFNFNVLALSDILWYVRLHYIFSHFSFFFQFFMHQPTSISAYHFKIKNMVLQREKELQNQLNFHDSFKNAPSLYVFIMSQREVGSYSFLFTEIEGMFHVYQRGGDVNYSLFLIKVVFFCIYRKYTKDFFGNASFLNYLCQSHKIQSTTSRRS